MPSDNIVAVYNKYKGRRLRHVPPEDRYALMAARQMVRNIIFHQNIKKKARRKISEKVERTLARYVEGVPLTKAIKENYPAMSVKAFLKKKTVQEELPKAIEIRQAAARYIVEKDLPTKYLVALEEALQEAKSAKEKSDAAYKLHKACMDFILDPVPEALRDVVQTNIMNIINMESGEKQLKELFEDQQRFIDTYIVEDKKNTP